MPRCSPSRRPPTAVPARPVAPAKHRPPRANAHRAEQRRRAHPGQRKQALAPAIGPRRAGKQTVAFEALQNAAEIAGIEIQFAAKIGGCSAGALGKLVENARLGQREAAVQQAFPQRADDARVEAAEPADSGDTLSKSADRAMIQSYD